MQTPILDEVTIREVEPLLRRLAVAVVDESLGRLPALQRLAVIACDVDQLERDEGARSLDVSEGSLRKLLPRDARRAPR